jgi:DNA (cytosine-5)-methyltransferase 1
MIGIDLFSGAGGMSLGAESVGIKVHVAVEANKHAAHTYAKNHTGTRVLASDIALLSASDFQLPRSADLILFGGPPCQGFSTSNQRTRKLENPSNWLFSEYLRFVKEIEPDWVVFENVKGILETQKGFFYRSVIEGLQGAGYTTSEWVLDAAHYGVPQHRWRVFVVGNKRGKKVPAPPKNAVELVPVRDAIHDLPILRNGASQDVRPYRIEAVSKYARLMRRSLEECANHLVTRSNDKILKRYDCIKAGGNWQQIPEVLMDTYADASRCHTGIYKRLRPDKPSIVIGNFRKNMLIHPSQNRGLSVREAARLQSFPDRFVFTGSIGFQQQQVGNAVPPLLAEAVFNVICRAS